MTDINELSAARAEERRKERFDIITQHLRHRDWHPPIDLECGCTPMLLCDGHADQRAVDHYGDPFSWLRGTGSSDDEPANVD